MSLQRKRCELVRAIASVESELASAIANDPEDLWPEADRLRKELGELRSELDETDALIEDELVASVSR